MKEDKSASVIVGGGIGRLALCHRPVVCAERREGQTVAEEVAVSPVGEGVTHGDGLGNLWGGDCKVFALVKLYLCRIEDTVGSGYLEKLARERIVLP